MAKPEAAVAMNRCPVQDHGMYPAASTMVPCPKCDRNRGAVKRHVTTPRLGQLEVVIGEAVARITREFKAAGEALREIRDERLYRLTHANFEDYCQQRFGFSRVRAHQLIEGSAIAGLLTGLQPLTTERQARELAPVLKAEGAEAVREVMEEVGSKPTAAKIRRVVKERRQPQLAPTYEIEQPCAHTFACSKCGAKK